MNETFIYQLQLESDPLVLYNHIIIINRRHKHHLYRVVHDVSNAPVTAVKNPLF